MSVTIADALTDAKLLGSALGSTESWSTWLATLKAAFGITLSRAERRAFESIAGSRKPPSHKVAELWALAGRGSGKSRMAAAIAVYIACFLDHDLDVGEVGFVLCLAGSRDQAQLVLSYIAGFMRKSPVLRGMIKSIGAFEVKLNNGVVIAVHSNSFRLIRGKTLLAVVADELAYWRDELSANPDLEVYRAVRPSLARTGGMWIAISSPYRRGGLLYSKHQDYFDVDDDDVLVVRGATELFNPTIGQDVIAKEMAKDPEASRSEWMAEFRSDISSLFDDQVIEDAVDYSRPLELPPRNFKYHAFTDASAGRHDAFSFCIGHVEGKKPDVHWVCDVIRGHAAPFDARSVAEEYATLARQYGCRRIIGDAFAGEWVSQAFRDCHVQYETSKLHKAVLYLESLPHFNRGIVSIPHYDKLIRELRSLERRVQRSGKDAVDHPRHGSDDYANALCGALYVGMHDVFRPRIRINGCPVTPDGRPDWAARRREEAEERRFRFIRCDESGRELSPEESRAIRHSLPGRENTP